MSTNDVISRLDAVIHALGEVDVADWSDATLRGHLDQLSGVLCQLDSELTRLAEAIRARGFRVTEPTAA